MNKQYDVFYCPACKSPDVRELVWRNPNIGDCEEPGSSTKYKCESCNKKLNYLDDVVLVAESANDAISMVEHLRTR